MACVGGTGISLAGSERRGDFLTSRDSKKPKTKPTAGIVPYLLHWKAAVPTLYRVGQKNWTIFES